MAKHTRKEFATLCGITSGNLSNYIKRGKVIADEDFIDDSLEINRDFVLKWQDKAQSKKKLTKDSVTTSLRNIKPDPGEYEFEDEEEEEDSVPGDGDDYHNLSKKKIKVEIAKKERETEILKLREKKIKGETMEVDRARNVLTMQNSSLMTAMKDGLEQWLIDISVKYRMSGEQLARERGHVIDMLNSAFDKSVIMTKKNMLAYIAESTIKREVGEHD